MFSLANDPAFNFVVREGVEGVEAKPEKRVILSHDSAVLRLIDSGRTDRLVWVGNDRIEIVANKKPTFLESQGDTEGMLVVPAEDLPEDLRIDLTNLIDSLLADDTAVGGPEDESEEVSPDQDELPSEDEAEPNNN